MNEGGAALPDAAAGETLDRFARDLVAGAAPVRLEMARAEHREAVFALRCRVALERGWVAPGQYPDGLEHDDDDRDARFVIGWRDDELVATARIVDRQADGLLPLERVFGVRVPSEVKSTQVDRVAITGAYRGDRRHVVLLGVLARAWQDISPSGARLILGVASPRLLGLYRELGILATPIGRAQLFWGERRHPILVDLPGTAQRLAARERERPE
jgi:predicted GNAT family N-acyltransferase